MNTKYRGFTFNTKRGNEYIYNDSDGTVTPKINTKNPLCLQKNGMFEEECPITNESTDYIDKISDYLGTSGYKQLTLIVNEQCNMRCKYCSYSGNYQHNRQHTDKYMSWQTAEQAVKRFHDGFNSVKIRNPSQKPSISFYGGEPLLNIALIRRIHTLVKKLFHSPVHFNLTTNATLLTKTIIDYFVENDFHLAFSLNGNREEHDRLRVFPDGTGSFDIVWGNLQDIRQRYPDYYQTNCMLINVRDIGTDLNELRTFFNDNQLLLPKTYMFNQVIGTFSNWYSRYSTNEYSRYWQTYQKLKKEYCAQLKSPKTQSTFFTRFFGEQYYSLLIRSQHNKQTNSLLPFTKTCIPGMKIAVSPDGMFHCCEKINSYFPIGDIEEGINLNKIKEIFIKYMKQIFPDCYKCPITRLCTVCFAAVGADGEFRRDPPDKCIRSLDFLKLHFSELWSLLEDGIPESVFLERKDHPEWCEL